jgi:hypothetical protein
LFSQSRNIRFSLRPEDDGEWYPEEEEDGEDPGEHAHHQAHQQQDLDGEEPGREQPFTNQPAERYQSSSILTNEKINLGINYSPRSE